MVTRRGFLQLATGCGVSFLLPRLAARAAASRGPDRPTSLITLWMAGGPSQLDTWDPHPGYAESGPIRAINTSTAGLQIAHTLPRMAEQMHHLTVIRSLVSKEGDHERGTYYVQTGYRPDPTMVHPALGSIVAHERPNPAGEIPQHISLADGPGFVVPRGGYLGDQLDAFRVVDPGRNLHNLKPRVDGGRQGRRLQSLEVLAEGFRAGRGQLADATQHRAVVQQALTMMDSEQLVAFDLAHESTATRQRYGDSSFGRGCLVARRLIETGVRAVQVVLSGFDTHADNYEGQAARCVDLDPAFAALVQDLVDRDLFESTIVLCLGEFGRTPYLNPLGGRDHWPTGFSAVIGGGGLRAGGVIGATAPRITREQKEVMPESPIEVPDLYATILDRLGIDFSRELMTAVGRPMALAAGKPLPALLP